MTYRRQMMTNLLIILSVVFFSGGQPCSGSSRNQRTDSMKAYHFLALGDSYTIGEGVEEHERWPVQLAQVLRGRNVDINDPLIIAQTGWTTDELGAAIDREKPPGPFDLVTLLIGVNNQYRGRSEQEYRMRLVDLLQRAIALAGNHASHVIVLSIPDWGVTPFAKGRDHEKIAREIDLFNAINREEAQRVEAQYVDVTPISRQASSDLSLLASDGLHPSGKMYEEWTRLAIAAALKVLAKNK